MLTTSHGDTPAYLSPSTTAGPSRGRRELKKEPFFLSNQPREEMKNLMAASLVLAAFMQHAYAAGQRYWIVTMPPTEYDVAYPGELTLWRFSDGDYPCGAGVAACALHRASPVGRAYLSGRSNS
jgi:hypothetical protein